MTSLNLSVIEKRSKFVFLEGARGIASIIVLIHHFLIAFMPSWKEPNLKNGDFTLVGTPFYFLANGSAAVTFFFVLSGFVLTVSFFKNSNIDKLIMASLKRLPRLFVPASCAFFLGFMVLEFDLNFNHAAASLTGSGWLKDFANANFPDSFSPSVDSVVAQSFLVFVTGETFYNTNLWTMRPELVGSLLVFILVAISTYALKGRFSLFLFGGVIIVLSAVFNVLMPFVVGTYMALIFTKHDKTIPLWAGMIGLIISLACLCTESIYIQTVGSALLIGILLTCESIAKPLSGGFGYWLGKISFPIYLVHAVIICSVSSWVYVGLASVGASEMLMLGLTALTTLVATLLISIPFITLENWWVPALNRYTEAVYDWATGRYFPAKPYRFNC